MNMYTLHRLIDNSLKYVYTPIYIYTITYYIAPHNNVYPTPLLIPPHLYIPLPVCPMCCPATTLMWSPGVMYLMSRSASTVISVFRVLFIGDRIIEFVSVFTPKTKISRKKNK